VFHLLLTQTNKLRSDNRNLAIKATANSLLNVQARGTTKVLSIDQIWSGPVSLKNRDNAGMGDGLTMCRRSGVWHPNCS